MAFVVLPFLFVATAAALAPPPLQDRRKLTYDWKAVAKRAAASTNAAFEAGHRRVSVDIPQISSVDRSTIARRFEDDNNFLLEVVALLGGGKSSSKVGAQVSIFEGGFEGGGDYLSDEGLYGYRWVSQRGDATMAVGNSEVGSTALSDLKTLDDGSTRLLLFNCALDRLSFFDKFGLPNLDDVEPAYLLRRAGTGYYSRQFPEDYALWRLAADGGQPALVGRQQGRFKPQDAEKGIRVNAPL